MTDPIDLDGLVFETGDWYVILTYTDVPDKVYITNLNKSQKKVSEWDEAEARRVIGEGTWKPLFNIKDIAIDVKTKL